MLKMEERTALNKRRETGEATKVCGGRHFYITFWLNAMRSLSQKMLNVHDSNCSLKLAKGQFQRNKTKK